MKAILLTLFLISCAIAQGQSLFVDSTALKAHREKWGQIKADTTMPGYITAGSTHLRYGEGPWLGGGYGVTFWQDGRVEVQGDTLQVLRLMWAEHKREQQRHEAARAILRMVGNNGWVDNPKAFDAAIKRYKLLMNSTKKK